jgi:pyridoxine kinase
MVLENLSNIGCKKIILTGVSYTSDTTGVVVYENGNYQYYEHKKMPKGCHGTGDIYASAFVGALVKGKSAFDSARIAADYVLEWIKDTATEDNHWYGAKFEPSLGKLIDSLK